MINDSEDWLLGFKVESKLWLVFYLGSSTGSDYTATTTTNQEGVMVELNEAEDHLNDIADGLLDELYYHLNCDSCRPIIS